MSLVLVAGCGYVGTALAARLVRTGDEVLALRRAPGDLPEGAVPVIADLTDARSLERSLPGRLDAIVYSASPDGRSDAAYRAAYVEGLGTLLEVLRTRSPKRIVMTSSTGVYAQTGGAWVDESSPTEPATFSGRRLLEGERLLASSPFESVALRLGGIYGPGRSRLLDQVRRGEAAYPPEPRYTNRLHRDDCAGALAHLLTLADPAPVYLGVDDDPADRKTLLEWLARELGAPAPRPDSAARSGRGASNKRCRNARLRASGYALAYPTFREGYAQILTT